MVGQSSLEGSKVGDQARTPAFKRGEDDENADILNPDHIENKQKRKKPVKKKESKKELGIEEQDTPRLVDDLSGEGRVSDGSGPFSSPSGSEGSIEYSSNDVSEAEVAKREKTIRE